MHKIFAGARHFKFVKKNVIQTTSWRKTVG